MFDDQKITQDHAVATLHALPGYPWLPCPICHCTEGCDHTVPERARAALPGLHLIKGM
jgi:hypothetical protein